MSRPSARTTWSIGQRCLLLAMLGLLGLLWARDASLLLWVVDLLLLGAFSLIVLVKLGSIVGGLVLHDMEDAGPEELVALGDAELPVYSILVPMYREPAMVEPMLGALNALDYPKNKLDVLLLLEADDADTQAAAEALDLPAWMRVIIAPEGKPKTKPRACNIGLNEARGEFLVIFDAEDRPETDQLRKAVATFRRLPEVSCLQACLNYYNAGQNLLTRWFTLEYSTWFDLFLPGLHSLHSPIPLGGTSNHFRSDTLRQLGGWDAWNVTEDCDLGMQMARAGLETRVLNSTTWEEAVSRLPIWLRQRSRWVKGYWQTLLVHTRQPFCGLREFGLWRYLMMWLVVGGHVLALALLPLCWLRVAAALLSGDAIFHPSSPYTAYLYVTVVVLGACNALFILVHMIAAWQRGQTRLWLAALGLPIYWLLMSWAAWKGVLQHLWAPFRWEKTTHGLADSADSASWREPPPLRTPQARQASLFLIAGCICLLAAAALVLPMALGFGEAISRATLTYENAAAVLEIPVEDNWQKQEALIIDVRLVDRVDRRNTVFKAIVHLKIGDGEWYQRQSEDCVRAGDRVRVTVPLTDAWQARDSKLPWGPWCLRRVRAAGLKLYTHDSNPHVALQNLHLLPSQTPEPPLEAELLASPADGELHRILEPRFRLSRDYKNPFDPREIDIAMEVVAPSGELSRATAFYFQDFQRHYEGGREILTTDSIPEWRARFAPREVGRHRWRLQGRDHHGDTLSTPWQRCEVRNSDAPGFIRVDPDDHRFFAYENGDFFFPIGMNLRSPSDNIRPPDLDFRLPSPDGGTRVMNGYLDDMAESGINLARVWMAPWSCGIEWHRKVHGYRGLGQYNLANARQLDWIIEHARQQNIVIDLALQNHGPFAGHYDMQWDENPYNRVHGGPLRHRGRVLVNAEARRLFAQRFRYIAARWGSDPTIFGWTAWIEVDALPASPRYIRSWHADMIPKLQAVDLGRHPVSTLYAGHGDLDVFALPQIGYTQIAAYAEYAGTVERFEDVVDFVAPLDKPTIIEEYGGSAVAGNMDMMAQQIHDGLWAGLMQPIAGAPWAWWWNLVFAKDLDRFHATVARFVGDSDLRGKNWHYQRVSLGPLSAVIRHSDELVWAWIYEDEQVNLRAEPGEIRGGRDWRHITRIHSRLYENLVGDRYDPLTATAPDRFDTVRDLSLPLSNLRRGRYQIEFWETWGSDDVRRQATDVGEDGRLLIRLPPLQRDLAIRVERLEE
jgi:cellulose synthase/poly-beta-1,6-N-acetylglucosamine synthase-like glycosyltransferase